MLWKRGRRSDNVVGADAGGGRRMPMGRGGGLGIGGVLIVVVIALFMGKNPSELLALLGGGAPAPTDQSDAPIDAAPQALPENEETDFVRAILGSTEDVWSQAFEGGRYPAPKLVIFSDAVSSACGNATSAVGPFYCSGDQRVYLDTAFFDDMTRQLNAPGEFARAYVIAHEVGHHIQNVTGVMQRSAHCARRAKRWKARTASACVRNCRPIVMPASGPTTRNASCNGSKPATSNRRSMPPPPSATTACSSSPAAMSCPTPSPTAPAPSA
jgi:predicted metalloprotease